MCTHMFTCRFVGPAAQRRFRFSERRSRFMYTFKLHPRDRPRSSGDQKSPPAATKGPPWAPQRPPMDPPGPPRNTHRPPKNPPETRLRHPRRYT